MLGNYTFDYFYQNHFKAGFDSEFFSDENEGHFHYITMGKLTQLPDKPVVEARKAAQIISQQLADPVLCLSGGLDSEAMALAFLAEKIPFTAAIMKFEKNLNEYDIAVARLFCEKHSIKYKEIEIPAQKILDNGDHLEIAEAYRTLSPERALFIIFLQKIEGHPVLGGEILRRSQFDGLTQLCFPKDRDLCYWRYFVKNKIKGIPYFHFFTPELAYSFMVHTSVGRPEIEKQDWKGRHDEFYKHKLQVYKEAGFEVLDTELRKQKWHGYEGLKVSFDNKFNSTEAYNRRFRQPLEQSPVYDLNQIFLVDDEDSVAHRILGTINN